MRSHSFRAIGPALLGLFSFALYNCSGGDAEVAGLIPEPPSVQPQSTAQDSGRNWVDRMGPCNPPEGHSGQPQSIDELVAYINAMAVPLSLDCFLQSLDRPLRMNTTKSYFSAQPAVGTRSPRIFLFEGPLILSIVPEGEAKNLLEMSEKTEPGRSIKAEIAFPVEQVLSPDSPFERLPLAEVTTCGVCHDREEPVRDIDGAVISERLRPQLREVVTVLELRAEFENCNSMLEPVRCSMLTALFDYGPVIEQAFPDYLPTIFD